MNDIIDEYIAESQRRINRRLDDMVEDEEFTVSLEDRHDLGTMTANFVATHTPNGLPTEALDILVDHFMFAYWMGQQSMKEEGS